MTAAMEVFNFKKVNNPWKKRAVFIVRNSLNILYLALVFRVCDVHNNHINNEVDTNNEGLENDKDE